MKQLEHNHCTQACAARDSGIFPARPLAGVAGLLMLATAQLAGATEQLDLQGTTITGNRELPKALHIVPWKAAEAGELAGRPLNSLVDELLEPIDRDVFLKELEYYEAVHSSR
jgi:hypothetical protein